MTLERHPPMTLRPVDNHQRVSPRVSSRVSSRVSPHDDTTPYSVLRIHNHPCTRYPQVPTKPETTCHATDGTEDESQPHSAGSSEPEATAAGSAATQEPTPSTTPNPPPPTHTWNGNPTTGNPPTSQQPATPADANTQTANAQATPAEAHNPTPNPPPDPGNPHGRPRQTTTTRRAQLDTTAPPSWPEPARRLAAVLPPLSLPASRVTSPRPFGPYRVSHLTGGCGGRWAARSGVAIGGKAGGFRCCWSDPGRFPACGGGCSRVGSVYHGGRAAGAAGGALRRVGGSCFGRGGRPGADAGRRQACGAAGRVAVSSCWGRCSG